MRLGRVPLRPGRQNSPSSNADLSCWRLTNTSLDDVAHVNLLDVFRLQSALLKSVLDGGDTELRG